MIYNFKKLFLAFSVLLTCFLYFYDLDNLDGLRQGTEGFYLQVSKEMNANNSIITPYYRGERHWSKPPLHFVLPFPLYKTDLFTNIHAARLSIAILTIFLLLLVSNWINRHFKIERHTSFLFFACTVGMFKYARIFMMEIPLSLLTFVSLLYYYDYRRFFEKKFLYKAIFFASCAILIKGPVSIIISAFALFLFEFFLFFTKDKRHFKKYILFLTFSIGIGSIWFFIAYFMYGDEFFNYFFLRENVGKFTAKSYPIRHVIQGLLIFSLPWSLFLPFSFLSIKDYFKSEPYHSNRKTLIYLITLASVFLIIWLIPSQRSHHYAMPAVPFFLTILLTTLVKKSTNIKREGLYKFSLVLLSIGSLILIGIMSVVTFYVDVIFPNKDLSLFMYLTVTVLIFSSVIFYKSKSVALKSLGSLIFIGWIWVVTAPEFIPTFVPHKVKTIIGNKPLYAAVRKPFFVEEALERKINVIKPSQIKQNISNKDALFFIRYEDYINNDLAHKGKILHNWEIWKRRTRLSQIINALRARDISSLKQKYLIFRPQ